MKTVPKEKKEKKTLKRFSATALLWSFCHVTSRLSSSLSGTSTSTSTYLGCQKWPTVYISLCGWMERMRKTNSDKVVKGEESKWWNDSEKSLRWTKNPLELFELDKRLTICKRGAEGRGPDCNMGRGPWAKECDWILIIKKCLVSSCLIVISKSLLGYWHWIEIYHKVPYYSLESFRVTKRMLWRATFSLLA